MPVASAMIMAGGGLLSSLFGAHSARKTAKTAAAAQAKSTAQMTAQADRASQLQYQLGMDHLNFNRRMYDESKPMADEIAGLQMDAQRQQMTHAQDYYDYNRSTFRPAEMRMAADAAMFDSEAYRERMAADATQRAALAFEGGQGALRRDLTRRGINPNSGAFAAMGNQNAIAMAGMQATGANNARMQAEQLGWARNLDVAGLGRNLPGASSAAYAGASGAGSAAMNVNMAPGGMYNQGFGQAAGAVGQGFGQSLNAYSSLMQSTTGMANNAMNNYYGALGSIGGMGMTAGAHLYGLSYAPQQQQQLQQTPQQRATAQNLINAMKNQ